MYNIYHVWVRSEGEKDYQILIVFFPFRVLKLSWTHSNMHSVWSYAYVHVEKITCPKYVSWSANAASYTWISVYTVEVIFQKWNCLQSDNQYSLYNSRLYIKQLLTLKISTKDWN